jgi:hypothetical protein
MYQCSLHATAFDQASAAATSIRSLTQQLAAQVHTICHHAALQCMHTTLTFAAAPLVMYCAGVPLLWRLPGAAAEVPFVPRQPHLLAAGLGSDTRSGSRWGAAPLAAPLLTCRADVQVLTAPAAAAGLHALLLLLAAACCLALLLVGPAGPS